MSNIDQGGFASVAFHSFADTLKWDAYSGDYGPNFVGHALNSGTYIIDHPTFGWQAFGGKVTSTSSSSVQVQTLDSVRRRVFIAPFATLFTLDAGAFTEVEFDTPKKSITLSISAGGTRRSRSGAGTRGEVGGDSDKCKCFDSFICVYRNVKDGCRRLGHPAEGGEGHRVIRGEELNIRRRNHVNLALAVCLT